MKKSYTGYFIGLGIGLMYNFLMGHFYFDFAAMLGQTIGVLLIPAIITLIIFLFSKSPKRYDSIFAYTALIFCGISLMGHFAMKS